MSTEVALIGLIAVILIIQRWKQQDVLEQIRAERNQVRQDEQARCRVQLNNAFVLYEKAIREGFQIADQTNNREKPDEN